MSRLGRYKVPPKLFGGKVDRWALVETVVLVACKGGVHDEEVRVLHPILSPLPSRLSPPSPPSLSPPLPRPPLPLEICVGRVTPEEGRVEPLSDHEGEKNNEGLSRALRS